MKKLLSFMLALLLLIGVSTSSYALNCAAIVDPDDGGPNVCIESVYNNAGATLDVGDVVVWDIEQSTGDNDNWVTTTTTAGTHIVAGVIYPKDILTGESGSMAVYGVVAVDMEAGSGGQTVDGPLCSSTTAGSARSCTDNSAQFGFVVTAVSGGSANAMIRTLGN